MSAREHQEQPVQRVPIAYFEAEFGPINGREHSEEIAPRVQKTPAFLVWPELLDDQPEADQ